MRAPRAALIAGAIGAAIWIGLAVPASAYLKFGITINGLNQTLRWRTMPVRYFVSDRQQVAGVSTSQFDTTVGRAFATWESVSTASIRFERVGITGARPSDDDSITVLGFESHPEMDRVLGSTSFTFDAVRG